MKKVLSIILAVLMAFTLVAFVGCSTEENLKLGLGVYSAYGNGKNADGETNGSASVATTAAVLLLDKDGKIVKCQIDTADSAVAYTSAGELVASSAYKTKGELGDGYGMVAYGGAAKEWDEQVAALCKVVEGKTLNEVKGMIVNGYKGNEEVINAGCTIGISDFILAIEKAFANAEDSTATAKDTLSLAFVTKQEKGKNATAEADGSCDVVSYICATAVDADGKVTAIKSDVTSANFKFNVKGEFKTDATAALKSKRELGESYGMSAYGQDLNGDGTVKEWFEQADVLDDACIGKTATDIAKLAVNGYGDEAIQAAGCTIAISDMVAVAVKAAE